MAEMEPGTKMIIITRKQSDCEIHRTGPERMLRWALTCAQVLVVTVVLASSVTRAQELIIPPDNGGSGRITDPVKPKVDSSADSDSVSRPEVRVFHAIPSDSETQQLREFQEDGLPRRVRRHEDLSITVSTPLLARFVNDETVKSKPVATQVLEANVSGMQTTTTSIVLQSIDCSEKAELRVNTEGTVSTSTVGVTRQATINTLGSHTFQVTKPVYFDGRQFLTKQAYGSLQARQFPQSVNTNVARTFPLLGQLGNQIAWNQVYRRMPMSDAIVVRKVADDVLPSVNKSVDEKLVKLNRTWSGLNRRLSDISLIPKLDWSASSTKDSMTIAVSDPEIDSRILRASSLTAQLRPREVCCVLLDELAVNHWIARQKLEGLEVSDADLQQLAIQLPTLMKQPVKLIEALRRDPQLARPALLFTVRLALDRPLQIQFRDGHLFVKLRFQLLPTLGQPSIVQEVEVSLQGEPAESDRWAMAMRDATVRPAEATVEPDTWSNVIQTQLDNLLQNQKPSAMSRILPASTWDERFPDLKLDRMQAVDGFLRIAFILAKPSVSL